MAGTTRFLVGLALLFAAAPAAASAARLHDQLSPLGVNAVPSDDFNAPQDPLDAQVADDFTVPPGQTWSISRVETMGEAAGTLAQTVKAFVYGSSGDVPGGELFSTGATATGTPNYAVSLPSPDFGPGTYWFSIQQLGAVFMTPSWAWFTRSGPDGKPAVFINPGGGFGNGCTTWKPINVCFAIPGTDMAFALSGRAISQQVKLKGLRRNTRRGTATLKAKVPGPGTVVLSGKGLARRSVKVSGARTIKLKLAATGAAAERLAGTGKAAARAVILFTATGAEPAKQTRRVRLRAGG